MGKLSKFTVTLSNGQGIYYGGQAVQGQVVIELTETMKMRGVILAFDGRAKVHWTETHTYSTGKSTVTVTKVYSAREDYFNQEIVLTGRSKGQPGQDIELHAGQHVFPFVFHLPVQIPSSFEGDHGHVRYTLKATIDKPWKFNHTTKRLFTVISMLDLNKIPHAKLPAQVSNSKNLCCLCCKSGPISAVFNIDRQGYVSGEAISLKAEIDNKSSRKMASSNVLLRMTTTFHATTKSRSWNRTVGRVYRGQIAGGDGDYWNGDQLIIPPLPPSYLKGCRIIDIAYTLELRVDPTGIGFDLVVPIQVVIGTIPLQQIVSQFPPTAPPPGPPMVMPAPLSDPALYQLPGSTTPYLTEGDLKAHGAIAPVMPTAFQDLPPPSYGESVFGKVDVRDENDTQHTQGETNFAPIYTYYNWGHTPSAPPTEKQQK